MKKQDLAQELIDQYVANTEEFWKETYKALQAPFHPWFDNRCTSLEKCISFVKNKKNLPWYLENFLFIFPILKGEYLLSWYDDTILTNYRLICKDEIIHNIALSDIKFYGEREEGDKWYNKTTHKIVEHGNSTVEISQFTLEEKYVNNAINRDDCRNLNEIQKYILTSSFYQLNKENENLEIPKITWEKSINLYNKLNEQDKKVSLSTTHDNTLENENFESVMEKDFVSGFKSIFNETLILPELNLNIDKKISSKIEMVLNNLYSEKYNKAYESINEILEDDSQLASCWFLKALLESLNPPQNKNYLDNIMLSLENFEKKVNSKEIKDKLIYVLYLIMTQNYVSKISYNVLKTKEMEKAKQEADTAAAISGVISAVSLSSALNSDKSKTTRLLSGGAALASGKFMNDSMQHSKQSEMYAKSLFGVAIAYSKLSVKFINLLEKINPQENSLQNNFSLVLKNWKSSNILLLNKIKLNLQNELKSLRKKYKSPVHIKSLENYDYSEFTGFQITLDLLGLDNHNIIKENKITKFIETSKSLYNKNKETINKYYKASTFFRLTYIIVIGLYVFANIFTGMSLFFMSFFQPGCWYLISFLVYFTISIFACKAKIHEKLSNNAKEFKKYLENIEFSEKDIDESKIGID